MTYPKTIPDFCTALSAYEPAEGHADAIYAAQGMGSPVAQVEAVIDALETAESLSGAGVALLVGAAYLIVAEGWRRDLAPRAFRVAARAVELG